MDPIRCDKYWHFDEDDPVVGQQRLFIVVIGAMSMLYYFRIFCYDNIISNKDIDHGRIKLAQQTKLNPCYHPQSEFATD